MIIQKLKIKIIALGKIKEKFLKEGINEFLKRLTPYASVSILELNPIEIKDENLTAKILLDEGEEFAQKIEEITNDGTQEIVFVIGSSCGIGKNVSDRANLKMSMSKMTFLHQFARLILVEQIYRAFKIIKGETYHK